MAGVPMPHLQSLKFTARPSTPITGTSASNLFWMPGRRRGPPAAIPNDYKQLRLGNCHLTDEALAAIFQSAPAGPRPLDLSHNSFTAAAIGRAVVGSPLWQSLRELGVNHCRLDNAAIGALTRVPLRRHCGRWIGLQQYRSERRGAALADWLELALSGARLHDNVIGDEGLIALASRPPRPIGGARLEPDCWNSRTFTFSDGCTGAARTRDR